MMSDRFMNRAVEISVGSLSPTINWTTLKLEEFELPPINQQRRIAEILWSMDKQITEADLTVKSSEELIGAELEHFLYASETWSAAETGALLAQSPRNGYSPPANESGCGLPTLSISAIRGGEVIPEGSIKYADVNPVEVEQFKLRKQDILVVRGNGNRLLCGRAGMVKSFPVDCFYPDLLIRLRFREDALVPEFAVMQWNESKTHLRLLKKAKSTNGISKINGQDVKSHKLFVPPLDKQLKFLDALKTKTAFSRALQKAAENARNLQFSLVNTLVG